MTFWTTKWTMAAFAALATMVVAEPASAQATRTWVSGVGDDSNPCSRTAPCRTFAGAISKTAAGGEINCLDPGIFGMLTITKSISIICDSQIGGIQADLTDDGYVPTIIVNVGANDKVLLSGLDIRGNLRAGQSGIQIYSGGTLHVRNSVLHFLGGCGIVALDASTVILDNISSYGNFCGLSFQKISAGSLDFALNNVRIIDSTRTGIYVGSGSSVGSVKGTMLNSVVAHTTSDVWGVSNHGVNIEATVGQVQLAIENSVFSGHKIGGIDAQGSGAKVTMSGSLVSYNGVGISAQGGSALVSYGDNILIGNMSNGTFTSAIVKK